jgi:hypothetical protein
MFSSHSPTSRRSSPGENHYPQRSRLGASRRGFLLACTTRWRMRITSPRCLLVHPPQAANLWV